MSRALLEDYQKLYQLAKETREVADKAGLYDIAEQMDDIMDLAYSGAMARLPLDLS